MHIPPGDNQPFPRASRRIITRSGALALWLLLAAAATAGAQVSFDPPVSQPAPANPPPMPGRLGISTQFPAARAFPGTPGSQPVITRPSLSRSPEDFPPEFTQPPTSQSSLETGPATRAAATNPADVVVPGEVKLHPTWGCIGINWYFTGDANRNAVAKVEFRRKGTGPWKPALRLFLHDFEKTTMLSGSIFRLCPGTEYEIRLTLADPDGGGETRTVSAATRAYPRMPAGKPVLVNEGGLAKAQELAEPGQVMLLARGTYPGVALTKGGKPGAPIVYRAARDGEVTIQGRIEIKADYVWLHGLVLRDTPAASQPAGQEAPMTKTIEGTGHDVCITGCDLRAHYCIHTPAGADNWFVADNTMTGDCGGRFSFDGEGVDFGSDRGGGHAVCYNEITDTADGVSYGGGNIDVYGNYIHETVDDCVEPDYAHENYRVWENRCYNSMCGLSFQPMKGGPWYFYNNIVAGNYLHALKVKKITGWTVLAGNTIIGHNPSADGVRGFVRGLIVDNVWLRTTPGPLTGSTPWRDEYAPTRIDYNAYSDPEVFAKIGYQALAKRRGWDRHSIIVDWREVFAEPVKAPASQPYYSEKLQGQPLPKDWRFEHSLFLPKEDSKLIDAGTVLPNLTGPYLGEAPDLGANELGLGTAWYGPRYWDTLAEVSYGLPEGWHSVTKDDPGKQAIIGLTGMQAILFNATKTITATFMLEKAQGDARWDKLAALVADDTGAQTGVIEFQDGLLMRLYQRPRGLALEVARIEPDGVLHVTVQSRLKDGDQGRASLFHFARSLYR